MRECNTAGTSTGSAKRGACESHRAFHCFSAGEVVEDEAPFLLAEEVLVLVVFAVALPLAVLAVAAGLLAFCAADLGEGGALEGFNAHESMRGLVFTAPGLAAGAAGGAAFFRLGAEDAAAVELGFNGAGADAVLLFGGARLSVSMGLD